MSFLPDDLNKALTEYQVITKQRAYKMIIGRKQVDGICNWRWSSGMGASVFDQKAPKIFGLEIQVVDQEDLLLIL